VLAVTEVCVRAEDGLEQPVGAAAAALVFRAACVLEQYTTPGSNFHQKALEAIDCSSRARVLLQLPIIEKNDVELLLKKSGFLYKDGIE